MSKLSYQEFREMEQYHEKETLIKICGGCGNPYKPELRTYNKDGIKKIVGNWFMSKYCDRCKK
ncbi:hypothetical protein LCGC14_0439190 [marine sediment metagenome]|uniref:Uncharacterized protein n=1 Tax=marine sediment metagenome TaxID=412755 RepID=A0A0F9V7U0_9ZZZZ